MKTSYIAALAPFLAAFLAPTVTATPIEAANALFARSYPSCCKAATDAAKIGDTTALNNAIAACNAAGCSTGSGSDSGSSSSGSTTGSASGNDTTSAVPVSSAYTGSSAAGYTPVLWHEGCYECGAASQYYKPGCHCEDCNYVTCG